MDEQNVNPQDVDVTVDTAPVAPEVVAPVAPEVEATVEAPEVAPEVAPEAPQA